MAEFSNYRLFIKRVLDVAGAGAGLLVSTPLSVAAAAAIRVESKGPVFYRQERVGRDGESFEMLKFRSMLRLEDSFDADGRPLENYDRVTKVGRILRATSLDELPQLVNVIKGDMSLVGPRPTLRYQVERYDDRQRGRLGVRPGLTGLAQVNGRNSLSWDEKIDFDLEYVTKLSWKLDLSIIVKTFGVILRQESVAFQSHDALSQHQGDYRANI
ncbi:sugar transferase [Citricoccus sp. NPDC079358]|uniref:sugar transferase n=1 Tax=Citricoccus sp. NPDC079358 TaxID=3154653 RepID=UPI003450E78D